MKKIIALLILTLIFSCSIITVYADNTIDLEKPCSITIYFKNGTNSIGSGAISLYYVAKAEASNGAVVYTFTDDFKDCDINLSQESKVVIDELGAYITQNSVSSSVKVIDENGIAVFENLQAGFYFAVHESTTDGYDPSLPFMIEIPAEAENGEYVYNVQVNAKVSASNKETDVETETDVPPGDRLPQTGQLKWPIPILFAVGMGFFAIGLILYSNNRKRKNEN